MRPRRIDGEADPDDLHCHAPRCRTTVDPGAGIQVLDSDGENRRYCWSCWRTRIDVEIQKGAGVVPPPKPEPEESQKGKEPSMLTKKTAQKRAIPAGTKTCGRCGKSKPTGGKEPAFGKYKRSPDGLSYVCKSCEREKAEKRAKKHPRIPSEKAVKRMIDREKAAEKSEDSAAKNIAATINL